MQVANIPKLTVLVVVVDFVIYSGLLLAMLTEVFLAKN